SRNCRSSRPPRLGRSSGMPSAHGTSNCFKGFDALFPLRFRESRVLFSKDLCQPVDCILLNRPSGIHDISNVTRIVGRQKKPRSLSEARLEVLTVKEKLSSPFPRDRGRRE